MVLSVQYMPFPSLRRQLIRLCNIKNARGLTETNVISILPEESSVNSFLKLIIVYINNTGLHYLKLSCTEIY